MAKQDEKHEKLPAYTALTVDLEKRALDNINKHGKSGIVFDKIVADYEDAEINRRIGIVEKAIMDWKGLRKTVDNTKPDLQKERDENGVVVSPARFSEAAWAARSKNVDKMNEIVKALVEYEDKNDFTLLDRLYGKNTQQKSDNNS